jgi:hypothetical protein
MHYDPPNLQAYWNRLLTGVLSLLTMRKTWLAAAGVLTAYSQARAGAITSEEFLGVVLASLATLIVAVTAEDIAQKVAQGPQP